MQDYDLTHEPVSGVPILHWCSM